MTLRFIDGFEGYNKANVSKFWDYNRLDANSDIFVGGGRRGGNCLGNNWGNGRCELKKTFNWDTSGAWTTIGVAFKPTAENYDVPSLIQLKVDEWPGTGASGFGLNDSLQLQFKKTSATSYVAIYTHPEPLKINTWYYIEMSTFIHATAGRIIGRLNEQEVCNWTGDNVPYQSSAVLNYLHIDFGSYELGRLDDIYILDDSGSFNNTFLGDIRVDNVHPNGAGNYTQFTPSAGANYECVDENPYSETDYVSHLTLGEKDSYAYADVPTDLDDTAIFGIQLMNQSQRTAGTDNVKIKGLLRTGAADYEESTAQSLAETFKSNRVIWEKDPSDSNIWTQAKINACEFGMEVN